MCKKIYYHDVSSAYPEHILKVLPGISVYASRALSVTSKSDVVILPYEVMTNIEWIKEHYDQVRLEYADKIVFGDYENISNYPDYKLSTFLFEENANRVRSNKKFFEIVSFLNSKNNFISLCQELYVPVPKTICLSKTRDVSISSVISSLGFPVYVKASLSASGVNIFRCENHGDLNQALTNIDGDFQIQTALPTGTVYLNVQYYVDDSGSLNSGLITNQILDNNSHNGNYHPSGCTENDIRKITDVLAKWAFDNGMSDIWAYDVAVTPYGEILPIECNPRWNSASYYSIVAQKLDVFEWQSNNIHVPKDIYKDKNLFEDIYFKNGVGIVVVNWATVIDNKLGVFIAGDKIQRGLCLTELKKRVAA